MRTYKAFYKGKTHILKAESMLDAQKKAAVFFGAKKYYEVALVLLDTPVDPASL